MGVVIGLEELLSLRLQMKKKGKTVVFTNGCFDILHPGHLASLEQAKALGDILVVGVNSDESVKLLKGAQQPIMPQEARAQILAALQWVDYVVIFDDTTAESLIDSIKPEFYVKGADYLMKPLPEGELVRSYGGKVVLISQVEGYSTSGIIRRILERFGAAQVNR